MTYTHLMFDVRLGLRRERLVNENIHQSYRTNAEILKEKLVKQLKEMSIEDFLIKCSRVTT